MPKVSVIIPTYNREVLLMGAVESVLRQTFLDLEVIVVDDGSTDETPQALERFLAERANDRLRVKYLWQENRGQTVATNKAMEVAAGEWIAFLDSDDRWLPEKLALQFEALNRVDSRCAACITDVRYTNNPALTKSAFEHVGSPYPGDFGIMVDPLRRVVGGWHGLYVQALIVRKEILATVGEFDPSLRLSYDLDFLFRLAAFTDICYVNKPLVEIDRTPNRPDGLIERFQDEKFRLGHYQHLYEKWLNEDRKSKLGVGKHICTQLQSIHAKWASFYLLTGDNRKARKAMWSSVRYNLTGRMVCKFLLTAMVPRLAKRIVVKRRQDASELVFG